MNDGLGVAVKRTALKAFSRLWRLRVLNPILRKVGLDYHKFATLVLVQRNLMEPDKSFCLQRVFKGFCLELDITKPTQRLIYIPYRPELHLERRLIRLLTERTVFFDIGAHIGYYTMLVASEPSRRVFSFEPSAANYQYLLRNINLNRFGNVRAFKFAISNATGQANLHNNPLNDGGNSLQQFHGYSDLSTELVQTYMLDDFVHDHAVRRVDIIKIDVEGHERKGLLGAAEVLRKDRPKILIESSAAPGELFDFLKQFGYSRFERLDNDGNFFAR